MGGKRRDALAFRTGVRPAMRVIMTVWLTPGKVYSAQAAAAAPQKLETPGVSS